MPLMWGVGVWFEGNIVGVEVAWPVIGRGLKHPASVVSPIGHEAFRTSLSW